MMATYSRHSFHFLMTSSSAKIRDSEGFFARNAAVTIRSYMPRRIFNAPTPYPFPLSTNSSPKSSAAVVRGKTPAYS